MITVIRRDKIKITYDKWRFYLIIDDYLDIANSLYFDLKNNLEDAKILLELYFEEKVITHDTKMSRDRVVTEICNLFYNFRD